MSETTKGGIIGFILFIIGLILFIPKLVLLPLIALFARRVRDAEGNPLIVKEVGWYTSQKIDAYEQEYEARMLPRLLYIFDTPDQYLPGGMYETTVRDFYVKRGWYLTTMKWLTRNSFLGLQYLFGKPATSREDQNLTIKKLPFGFTVEIGYSTHRKNRVEDGQFWKIPTFSIKSPKASLPKEDI